MQRMQREQQWPAPSWKRRDGGLFSPAWSAQHLGMIVNMVGILYFYHSLCVACYCMSAMAIHQILESNPRAAGPRASANIMTYSPHTNVTTRSSVPIYVTAHTNKHFHMCQYLALPSSFAPQTHLWNLGGIPFCSSDTAPSGTGKC